MSKRRKNEEYMPKICKLAKPGTIITDICGNKREVIKEMEKLKQEYEDTLNIICNQ